MRNQIRENTMSEETRAVVVTVYDTNGNAEQISAFASSTPGLVYHRTLKEFGWTVTHERSGMLLACFDDGAHAKRFAADIADLADWTCSGAMIHRVEGIVAAFKEACSVSGSHKLTSIWHSAGAKADRLDA